MDEIVTIEILNPDDEITIISINEAVPGPPGDPGEPGPGLPVGGTAGQIPVKQSGDDFDTAWADPGLSSGVGNVVGPSSAVDSRPALFDGTTGKLLKQGSAALGTAAFTNSTAYDVAGAALAAGGAAADALAAHLADHANPHAVTKAQVGLGSVDNTSDATKPVSAAQAAADAAARAFAIQRANHTGTQSADTLTDGTTNKAFLATERTKLAGIATGATANSSDATLLARGNHTGTQLLATISNAGTAAALDVAASGDAAAGQVVKGNDSRLVSGALLPAAHAASHASAGSDPVTLAESQVTGLVADLAAKATTSALAAHLADTANPHGVTKAQVGLGSADNTSDAGKPVSTATQTALDLKVAANAAITGATKTKITYDAKGLVTAGADATTADIADSSNKRYVSDAQLVVLGNTSGTNTGDQDLSSLATTAAVTAAIAAAIAALPAEWVAVPSSSTATGTAGQKAYDADYEYTCVATNTWRRKPHSDW